MQVSSILRCFFSTIFLLVCFWGYSMQSIVHGPQSIDGSPQPTGHSPQSTVDAQQFIDDRQQTTDHGQQFIDDRQQTTDHGQQFIDDRQQTLDTLPSTLVLRPSPPYFQQVVNYKIEVTLDDKMHELNAFIEIEYFNQSPDTLSFIYFHLWPNAYKDHYTAFAKQQLENRDTKFYFSKPEQRGFIDELNFEASGKKLAWEFDAQHIDICKVMLTEPLRSGEKIVITTPFRVKIPDSFSRLGHVGNSYQITQWYPKPAVYDRDGWHPMPYLDQGEFYSEFGNFDVKITLPKNYVVGASGNLQNAEELEWLNLIAEKTAAISEFEKSRAFPASDSATKTIHYILENAHDFAWFADKRFHVLKGEVTLPHSGRKVTTWAMFTNYEAHLWKNSLEYLQDATYYYSLWIGDYAYENVTAVEGALSAGGGMEYPTITIIGRAGTAHALETVIMHEVGHNWFYGMLGTNERMHPWMDEGINSFYENRYFYTKYPGRKWVPGLQVKGFRRFFDIDQYKENYLSELFYLFTARQYQDQPISMTAEAFTTFNYGAIVYSKAGMAFEYLKAWMDDSLFDQSMQRYFEEWKFKHPQPDDLREVLETASGKNLDWFFETIIGTDEKMDYKITRVKKDKVNNLHTVRIRNRTGVAAPVPVDALRGDSIVKTVWVDGFEGKKEFQIENEGFQEYRIDAGRSTLEFQRKNNNYRLRGLLPKVERFRFQLFGSVENSERTQLFFTPVLGWNHYDKTTVGIAFYNHLLPHKKFEFELVPLFGTASYQFAGIGRMGYNFYTKGSKIHNINLSVHGKRFSYGLLPEPLTYSKIEPTLIINFRKPNARSHVDNSMTLRSVNVWQEYRNFFRDENVFRKVTERYVVNEAAFHMNHKRAINPFRWTVALQQANDFIRTFGELNYMLTYNKQNKGLHVRVFAGAFLWNNRDAGTLPDARFRLNFSTGREQFQKDFLFDEFFYGRNETTGFLSQQIAVRDGGFRTLNNFGQTDKWLSTIHLSSTIPGKIPVRPFMTVGAFGQPNSNFNLACELGISLVILEDIFEIYFPLLSIVQVSLPNGKQARKWYPGIGRDESENLYRDLKYRNLITFQINIRRMNPFNFLRDFSF